MSDEDWRFTNVAPIAQLPFTLASEVVVNGAESKVIDDSVFSKLAGHRLVFVNGFFSTKLSCIKPVSGGARIESLSAALAKDSGLMEKHLGKYAHTANNTFAALNQAFFSDGAFIFVPAGRRRRRAGAIDLHFHPRNMPAKPSCRATSSSPRRTAKLTVVESYVSTGNAAYFTNAVTELIAGDNATSNTSNCRTRRRTRFTSRRLRANLAARAT